MTDVFAGNSHDQPNARGHRKIKAFFSMFGQITAVCILLITGSTGVSAFTQVVISTGAPTGVESNFLAAMSQQFNVKVVPNPLAANTYAVTLYGPNPNYQALPPPPTNLQEALSLGATVYIYGFAEGMAYQQHVEEGLVEGFAVLCSTPSAFDLSVTTTTTFDLGTCQDTLGTVNIALFEQSLSTPTVIPGVP